MAINLNRVSFGNAQRGWTAGSIAPRAPISGPVANIGTSGNIPSNILQAIGNLNAEQAFRNFMSGQVMNQQPSVVLAPPPPNEADLIRAKLEQERQQNLSNTASLLGQSINRVSQRLSNQPTLFGGIMPMGMGAERAGLQQQQFDLSNQLAATNAAMFGTPRTSGWVGGF